MPEKIYHVAVEATLDVIRRKMETRHSMSSRRSYSKNGRVMSVNAGRFTKSIN